MLYQTTVLALQEQGQALGLYMSLASATTITVLFSRYFCPSTCHEFILESGNIASLILQPTHYMVVSGQLHALAA
jgi:hypothetical protein